MHTKGPDDATRIVWAIRAPSAVVVVVVVKLKKKAVDFSS